MPVQGERWTRRMEKAGNTFGLQSYVGNLQLREPIEHKNFREKRERGNPVRRRDLAWGWEKRKN